jgi:predicted  nucleic acid-binding Zn-ribbon protein
MKHFLLGLLIGIFVVAGSFSAYGGFMIRNQNVVTTTGERVLTPQEIAQALITNQDHLDQLQGELSRTRQENQKLRKDLDELESTVTQLKNMYFRRF